MRTGKNTRYSKRHLRRWVKIAINFLVCVMLYLASFYAGTGIITLIDYHRNKTNIAFVEYRDSEVFFQDHIDDFKKWQRREWEKEETAGTNRFPAVFFSFFKKLLDKRNTS